MTDATRNQLEQAYRLIQQEELDKAIAILKPVLAAQPDNLDAWWLMANAVTEPADARNALDNVLRLDPNHWQARDLLNKLNNEYPDAASAPAAPPLPTDTSLDDLFSTPSSSSSTPGISSDELDRLLSGQPSGETSRSSFDTGFSATSSEAEDLEGMFGESSGPSFAEQLDAAAGGSDPFSDPFASREPGFVEQVEAAPQQKAKPRRAPREEKKEKPGKKTKIEEPKPTLPYEAALVAERRFNSRPNPVVLVVLLLLVVLVVGGGATFFLLPRLTGTTQGTGTPVALATGASGGAATSAANTGATSAVTPAVGTVIPSPASTQESAGGAADVAGIIQATNDLFTANKFSSAKASVVQSSLGDTFQVQVCGAMGPDLQSDVYRAMDMLADQAAKLRSGVKAGGIEFVSCAQPDVILYRAVAPMDTIVRYVEGGMTNKRDFHAAWQRS